MSFSSITFCKYLRLDNKFLELLYEVLLPNMPFGLFITTMISILIYSSRIIHCICVRHGLKLFPSTPQPSGGGAHIGFV